MATLFPVTTVGSWSRTPKLLSALRKRQSGEISEADFQKVADDEVLECLRLQDEAGVDIVTDGELRRDNFYSFVADKLDGCRLMTMSELMDYIPDRARFEEILRAADVPAFAMKNPVVYDKISISGAAGLSLDEAEFLKANTDKDIKIPLPGPFHLTRAAWFPGISKDAYPTREDLAEDLVKVLRQELIALRDLGVAFVQFDEPTLTQVVYGEESEETFMCAALASRRDPTEELEFALELMNETVRGVDGIRTGVHICRGNWSRKENVLLQGNYGPLLPHLERMNVDQMVLEMATPRAGEVEVFKEYGNAFELGLGVVNPRSDDIEGPDVVIERTKSFLEYFSPEKIYLNPDCGFGTFAERTLNPPEVAFKKLKVIDDAAQTLRAEYGG